MKSFWKFWNKGSHVAVGAWTGWAINDSKYRNGGWAFLVSFLFYQWIEQRAINDEGYSETKEFMIGMGISLLLRRLLGK